MQLVVPHLQSPMEAAIVYWSYPCSRGLMVAVGLPGSVIVEALEPSLHQLVTPDQYAGRNLRNS